MAASPPQATHGDRRVKSLEELLAKTSGQLDEIDVAEMNLLCATGLPGAANLDIDKRLATLGTWAGQVRYETDRHLYRFRQNPADFNHSEGSFRMLMMVTVLQQDFRVRYNPDRIHGIDFRDSRDLFIHGLLEEPHTGTCASMPVLYVAVGRHLGYPLRLVLTHGHVFVRWEGPDGRERFNIECASQGMLSFDDDYYKTWPTPLTDEQVRKGRYLISLSPAEDMAVFMESRGHCLLDNGRTREARIAYEEACRLDPLSPGCRSWLAEAMIRECAASTNTVTSDSQHSWEDGAVNFCLPLQDADRSAKSTEGFSLDSARYRNFHPTLGRWIERDPPGYVDGMNLYQYVSSDPVDLVDALGLCGGTAPQFSLNDLQAQILPTTMDSGLVQQTTAVVNGQSGTFTIGSEGRGDVTLTPHAVVAGSNIAGGPRGVRTPPVNDPYRSVRPNPTPSGTPSGSGGPATNPLTGDPMSRPPWDRTTPNNPNMRPPLGPVRTPTSILSRIATVLDRLFRVFIMDTGLTRMKYDTESWRQPPPPEKL